MVPDQTLPVHARAEICMQLILFWWVESKFFFEVFFLILDVFLSDLMTMVNQRPRSYSRKKAWPISVIFRWPSTTLMKTQGNTLHVEKGKEGFIRYWPFNHCWFLKRSSSSNYPPLYRDLFVLRHAIAIFCFCVWFSNLAELIWPRKKGHCSLTIQPIGSNKMDTIHLDIWKPVHYD